MKTYKELRQSERLDLAETSPLPAPLAIYVEPTNVCNFRCLMCPESLPDYQERAGYYQALDYRLYQKIIADIRELGGINSLKLYFEGEPLLNNRLDEMVTWAKMWGVAERIEITTNASLLTNYRAGSLVNAGLDYLQISIYSVLRAEHARITGQDKFHPGIILANVEKIRRIREERGRDRPFIHCKLMYDSEEGRMAFEEQYAPVADEISVQAQHNWMGDIKTPTLTQIQGLGEQPTQLKKVCPFPFYMLTIKANGDVSVCCVDWSGQLVLGNVKDLTLKQMWEGDKLKELRLAHLRHSRDTYLACRNCDALYTSPDNLDSLNDKEYLSRCR